MALAMIIFEDVNPTENNGNVVRVRMVSSNEDCQDESIALAACNAVMIDLQSMFETINEETAAE
jgi:hypothetical protein